MSRLGWVLLPLALAGCGPVFDAPTLADAVGSSFASLYTRAQEQQGRTEVTAAALGASATCQRGGGGTLDVGPGDDWRCLVSFRPPGSAPQQVRYDVTLKPEGCYTAAGPPAIVGDATVIDVEGVRRQNPIYAFDGCL